MIVTSANWLLVKNAADLTDEEQTKLNYFQDRLSSGVVEGLHNKLKVIKRLAYGYRNFDHFRLRVLVECDGGIESH